MARNQSEGELGGLEDSGALAGGEQGGVPDAQEDAREGVEGVQSVQDVHYAQDEDLDGDMGPPPSPRTLVRTGSNNRADDEEEEETTRQLVEKEAAAAGELVRQALVPEAAAKLEQEADELADHYASEQNGRMEKAVGMARQLQELKDKDEREKGADASAERDVQLKSFFVGVVVMVVALLVGLVMGSGGSRWISGSHSIT